MVNKQQQHYQKDHTDIFESLRKFLTCQSIVSLKVPPCQSSLWKCLLLIDCLSYSSPLSIVSSKVPPLSIDCLSKNSPLSINCLSKSAPLSIISPKVNPCWLTVFSKSVLSSIKQKKVRAKSVEYENSKRNILVFKWSSLTLNYIPFNFHLAFVRCCKASSFFFFHQKCGFWFLDVISCLMTIY